MTRRRGPGEGHLRRRSDGRWEGRITVSWQDGRLRKKSVYGRTRREAVHKMQTVLRTISEGLPVVDDRQTVGRYLEWWIAHIVPQRVRLSTEVSYGEKVRLHLVPALGRIALSKLSPQHVTAFMKAKLDAGMTPRGVNYCRAVLRVALHDAERMGIVSRNAAALASPVKVSHKEVVPLTQQEARQLLSAASEDRLYALYAVGIALGLRLGEVLGLKWQDLDLDQGTLRVRRSLQRLRGELRFVEPKSERSRRTVPLPKSSVGALRRHRVRQTTERLQAGGNWMESGLVFTTSIGTPIDPRNLHRWFDSLCNRAGVGKRRFHDLRHTAASLLLAQGVPPRVVMETLGHSQMSLTTDLYGHVFQVLQRAAAEAMDEALLP